MRLLISLVCLLGSEAVAQDAGVSPHDQLLEAHAKLEAQHKTMEAEHKKMMDDHAPVPSK